MGELKIGMIGLDTSHAPAFTDLLNNEAHPHHVPGGRVRYAYPGGSPDFSLSRERVEGFTARLREEHGVEMLDSIEDVTERADAILLESVDGRQHLDQFRRIAPACKPVFIDKPLATSSREAAEIFAVADQYGTPVFSASSLRYAHGIAGLAGGASVLGCVAQGPNDIRPDFPGMFWYGIHAVEILYSFMGTGCQKVHTHTVPVADVVVGEWHGGRIGQVYGFRIKKGGGFGATVFTDQGFKQGRSESTPPPYALLLQTVMAFFNSGKSPLDRAEMLEVIRFIEAADESKASGETVRL